VLANTEILRCAQDDSHFRMTQHGVFGEPIGDAVLRFDFGREDLLILGRNLDEPDDYQRAGSGEVEPGKLWQRNRRDGFIEEVLKIRTKSARGISLKLNRAQREYSCVVTRNKAKKNVVLKARQVGITTYIAARFFVQTITHEGTLSLQVTHDRESAEDVFRIVRRFWENLPDHAREGTLRTSHCNARQLVFRSWTASTAWRRRMRMRDEGGRSRTCIVRKFRAGAEKVTRRWHRCGRGGTGRRHCAGVDGEWGMGTFL